MKRFCFLTAILLFLGAFCAFTVGCSPSATAYIEISTAEGNFFVVSDSEKILSITGDDAGKKKLRAAKRPVEVINLAELVKNAGSSVKIYAEKNAEKIQSDFLKASPDADVKIMSAYEFTRAVEKFCYAPEAARDEKALLNQAQKCVGIIETFDTAETDAAFMYFVKTRCAVYIAGNIFADADSKKQIAELDAKALARTEILMQNALTPAAETMPEDEVLPVLSALLDFGEEKEKKLLQKLASGFDAEACAEQFRTEFGEILEELHRRANPNDTY